MKKLAFLTLALGLSMGSCQNPTKPEERTLRMNIYREPGTFDPRRQSDMTSDALLRMLYEGLTRVNSDASIEPAGAEAIEISEDRTIYTFHLTDCKWSNGEPITAFDYAQTWLDLLDPKFHAPNAHRLTPIKNAMLAKKGEVPLFEVGLSALNECTLVVELSSPFPGFLHLVGNSYLAPIYHKNEETYPNWYIEPHHHVSNGPFHLTKWSKGIEIQMARNPHFRGKRSNIDELHMTIINNDSSALHMFANGNLDLIGTTLSPIPLSYLKDLKERDALHTTPVAATHFISFNIHEFPFTNVNIRKAFATAINRKNISEYITQLDEEPALGAVPPILKKGRRPAWISDGNIDLAKEYLEKGIQELGITKSDLADLTFIYFSWEATTKIAQAVQQQWLECFGINVNLEAKDPKTAFAMTADGSYQFGMFLWQADYCDVSSLLERFRYAKEFKNYPHWHNPEFVRLLDASSLEIDPEKRLDILEAAEKILVDEMPIAPILHHTFAFMMQSKVEGFTLNPIGQIYFDEISLKE
jgi:oligopeptide transport system substrate-binding protein